MILTVSSLELLVISQGVMFREQISLVRVQLSLILNKVVVGIAVLLARKSAATLWILMPSLQDLVWFLEEIR